MTLKQRFVSQYGRARPSPKKFSLNEIKNQAPVIYSTDIVMRGVQTKHCDYFVFCDCAPSTTGIYVVEVKGASPSISEVKRQLQGGANFISSHIQQNDQYDFSPVLVAKGIHGSMRAKLVRETVILGEKTRYIKHVKVGSPLQKIRRS